jgi:succinoglycan biosynthesis transport protein ExoP
LTIRHYLGVLRRRAWVVLLVLVLSTTAAVALSVRQQRLYTASADVWLTRFNLGALLTGTDDPNSVVPSERLIQTQARLARLPVVAERTLAAIRGDTLTPTEFLETSSVVPDPQADLLRFEVTSGSARLASKLATAYARQFTLYRRQLDTTALQRARDELDARMAEMRAEGARRSAVYRSLMERQQELATLLAVQTGNAILVRPAGEARQVQPRPLRAAFIGLGLGLVAGIALAFLAEALDTRVRSIAEITAILGMPLLARIPEPPRRFRRKKRLVMLAEPSSAAAEPYRALRTSVDLAVSGAAVGGVARARPKTIMVTSAVEGEGKTTTVANLAIALARTGRHVVLVDLDFRRPGVGPSFHLEPGPGVIDAALGTVPLSDALVPVSGGSGDGWKLNGGSSAGEGVLEVLPAGEVSPLAGDLVATEAFQRLVTHLRGSADVILVDSPPLLGAGDALAVSALVDSIVVVTRYSRLRRPSLLELRRVLDRSPARSVGFVLTELDAENQDHPDDVPVTHEPERRPAPV